MAIKIDLTGHKYGKLTVLKIDTDIPGKKKKWLCKCDCGNEIVTTASNLRGGHTKSCVVCGIEASRQAKIKHGQSHTKLFYVWNSMKNRCENPNAKSYKDYGAKGISVCEEWHDSSKFFEWAFANGYEDGLEIDRIDVYGNYEPSNCRWITKRENANNKRNNKLIDHNGMTKTLAEWSRYYDVSYKNLSRLLIKGYSMDNAIKRLKDNDKTHMNSKSWKQKYEAQPKETGLFEE